MLTYKKAGVNIDLANKFVKFIKKYNPEIGSFSGLYPLNKNVFLSASSDGIGTKLKLLHKFSKDEIAGIDLVAMNVNDIICCGAKPLFFLDYFSCSKLDLNISKKVIKGIINGCRQADCILLGGETAEMPGIYKNGDYDLAGFAVGIVHKKNVIDGSKISNGDIVIGLMSSGPHSNGFSLIRKIFNEIELEKYKNVLLNSTIIYVKQIMDLLKNFKNQIKGISHITGGGFYDNIERILPEKTEVIIFKNSWKIPDIFKIIQSKAKISDREMFRTFNMGIGMVLIVSKNSAYAIHKFLKNSFIIGEVKYGKNRCVSIR